MLNKVTLMGRLTAEPELRRTTSGTAVTSFSLAVERSKARDGNKETDFIDVVAWSGTAELVCKYLGKGRMVVLCGRLQTRNWEDKSGNRRKSVEVVADEIHFVGSKNDSRPQAEPITAGDFTDDDGELPF